jgi:hypothetical protein
MLNFSIKKSLPEQRNDSMIMLRWDKSITRLAESETLFASLFTNGKSSKGMTLHKNEDEHQSLNYLFEIVS